MRYRGTNDYDHSQPPRVGVLLTNLGTPDAPEKSALRRYLKEFLSDPRVVEVPRLLWFFILHGVILNVRPARSAKAYRSVWTDAGSPLLVNTKAQAEALRASLGALHGDAVVVDYAMRYGSRSIAERLQALLAGGVQKLLVLPLYPQYSGPTAGSTFDALAADFQQRRWLPQLRFVAQYHDHPAYIAALANSVKAHREQYGSADKLLMSYHGVPQRYLDQGDPYHCQCHKTSRLLAAELGLMEGEYLTCFQSRFGREPWLTPYTDVTLQGLPAAGVRSVQVVCPGFAADCLETLEEIGVENRDYFLTAGGERYEYIPCLNSQPAHIEALTRIVNEQLQGWLPLDADGEATARRARLLGADR
ncbi:ferrochelatase [Kineobactrum salinum]|uniref:Ferrochelatase n=1 Tax=Kineobactrum salinum TaxID=2708301 RepID=A0A6C0U2E2_9GAMM|nr:ferrochelatase [Kineobactrum salinum]QIB66251.1 ferrochelatase [Kineobactrum salinum]